MRFQRTRDILLQAQTFHTMASNYFLDLERELDQKRVRILLDYLVKHEENLASSMEKFREDVSHDVLDAWFDNAPDIELDKALASLAQLSPQDIDDVIRVGMHLGDYLIWAYESLAEQAETGEVREAFESLASLARAEKRKLSIDSNALQDF